MTLQEAYEALGISPAATAAEVRAAYDSRSKACHPDLNGGGADMMLEFLKVLEAFETVTAHRRVWAPPGNDNGTGGSAGDQIPPPVRLVQEFIAQRGVEILFDGSMRLVTASRGARGICDVEECLRTQDIDAVWFVDELLLEHHANPDRPKKADIERALRRVVRHEQTQRKERVARPLFAPLDAEMSTRADAAWDHLVGTVFSTESGLARAVLSHFIWQVKQKMLYRPVTDHLMPVIFGMEQGSGKTTFVREFLSPLRELATGPVLLSDVADKRSGDIFRFPVLLIDDMERIDRNSVSILKSIMTDGKGLRRRLLGTSTSITIAQRTTLIGTTNTPVRDLVFDPTGHRRFATLPFRNGAVAKGGDPAVWTAVTETDYGLLWRSVDAFGPSPIKPYLSQLAAEQGLGRDADPLREWLRALDLNSEPVLNITTRNGVAARGLWQLFCNQTGKCMSETRFGTEMKAHVADPDVPFGYTNRTYLGNFYPVKAPPRSPQ